MHPKLSGVECCFTTLGPYKDMQHHDRHQSTLGRNNTSLDTRVLRGEDGQLSLVITASDLS